MKVKLTRFLVVFTVSNLDWKTDVDMYLQNK